MSSGIEALADAALVAVISAGDVIGTGFVIDSRGSVLTCHHVVDGLETIRLRGSDGTVRDVSCHDVVVAADIDLVVIEAAMPTGMPLPLASGGGAGTSYWTKGYHMLGEAVRASFPVQGQITGGTSVSYQTATSDYRIDGVLVLAGDAVNAGLSGAPVLDLENEAVVGVVSTRLVKDDWHGGFAVPVAQAAAHPTLAEAVARNQEAVPAYGAYLNPPAARDICTKITESEIEKLTRVRRVDLARRVPRVDAEAAIGDFLGGNSPVLAVVGQSGVGKSTELVALARQLPGRSLLLRGSSLSHGSASGGLGGAVQAALGGHRPRVPLPPDADEAVARAMGAGEGLIVILDALNEAPFSGAEFEEWIADTRSWLQATAARLVVSCRAELWADLVGPALVAPSAHGRVPVVLPLGGFSDDEYHDALRAYGLAASSAHQILRLPLVVGLCARSGQARQDGSAISLNRATEAYVEDRARSLAAKAAGKPLSAQVMRSRLVSLGGLMWEQQTDVIDPASLAAVFGDYSAADLLVSDGLLTATPSGCRFAFDSVADWLQGQAIDLDRELAAVSSSGDSALGWHRIGPLAAALRDLDDRGEREVLRSALTSLLMDSDGFHSLGFRVTEGVLQSIQDASPYADVLERMLLRTAAEITPSDDSPGAMRVIFRSLGFWASVPLPIALHLGFLRQLAQFDYDYNHWRPKDWKFLGIHRATFESGRGYSDAAHDLVRSDPGAGVPALLAWLDDHSPLKTGEATVAEVAQGILYDLRSAHPNLIWQAMNEAGDTAQALWTRISMDDPEFLVHMISVTEDSPDTDEHVLSAASAVLAERGGPLRLAARDAVYRAVAKRYERGIDWNLRGMALGMLISGPESGSYVEPIAIAYEEGLPGVSEWTLAAAAARDTAGIIAPILLSAVDNDWSRPDALLALGNSGNVKVQEIGDRAVRAYLESGGAIDGDIGNYAESRLWRGHVANGDLLAIVEFIAAGSSAIGHYQVMGPLADPAGLSDPNQRASLFRQIVDHCEPESLKKAARELMQVMNEPDLADVAATTRLLRYVLDRMDSNVADTFLWSESKFNFKRFAGLLARMLADGRITPPGPLTAEFRDRVVAGESPDHALDEMFSAMRDRGV